MTQPGSTDGGDERTAALLAQALQEEAGMVDSDPGALQSIQRRTRRQGSPGRQRWALAALGAGVATAATITAVVLIGNQGDEPGRTPTATHADGRQTSQPPTTGGATNTGPRGMHRGVYHADGGPTRQMYYLGHPGIGGARLLYYEPHSVPKTDGMPSLVAVREFLTSYPIDGDYQSGWPEGVDVAALTRIGNVVTMALTGDADLHSAGDLRPQAADAAIQAIVRTAGISRGRVAFTYNDRPVTTLLGVDVSKPVPVKPDLSADYSYVLRAFVQVSSPVEGETVKNPVIVTGSGNTFEGTVNWQLLDGDGIKVRTGFVTTAQGMWRGFTVRLGHLDPGTYTFRALEYSAQDGQEQNVDDKTFTVE